MSETEKSPFHKPYFLFAGRLKKNKGVQNLIPFFKEGKSGHLIIVGDGFYRSELETLASGTKYGLKPKGGQGNV